MRVADLPCPITVRCAAAPEPLASRRLTRPHACPIVVDVEASGLGRGSYPIEVGVALADGALMVRLIKPAPHWTHWDECAERVHGLSRRMIETQGGEPVAVARELNELLAGQTVYSDGWGADRSWLARLFDEAGLPQRFRLDSIYGLLDEQELSAWPQRRDQVSQWTGLVPHRAGTDALLIQHTYLHILDRRGTSPATQGQRGLRHAGAGR